MFAKRNRVFGIVFGPNVLTFFDSWKSDAARRLRFRPRGSFGASLGSTKIAMPELGSYAAAPIATPSYAISIEYGSTPAPASCALKASVGRPAATRRVSSLTVGGRRSFTQ